MGEGRPQGLGGAALHAPAGRRVPGLQHCAEPAAPRLGAEGKEPFCHRGPGPVCLRFSWLRPGVLPAGGGGFERPGRRSTGQKLPLYAGDRGLCVDGHRTKRRCAQGAGGRPAHRRACPRPHGGESPLRSHLCGQGDRAHGGRRGYAGGPEGRCAGPGGGACLWGHRRALPHPAAGGAAGAVPESGRYPLCGGGPGGFPERRTGAGRAVFFSPPDGAGGHAVLPFRPDAGAGLPGGLGGGRPHTVDDAGGDRGGARPDAGGEIRPGSLGGELEPSGAESAAGPPAGKAWKTAGALGGRRRLRWGGTNPQAVEYGGFLSGYGGPASKSDVGPGAGPAAQRRTGVCVGGGDADDAPWLQGP